MDMSYYKKMEPVFGEWRIKRLIGEGNFGKVFEIEREDFGRNYSAALKVITIPQNESEVKSVVADGMDEHSITMYYRGFVEEMIDEFALMSSLKGNSNIVSYEDHKVIEHKDAIGWDILIRMELLTPLIDYIAQNGLTRRDVVRLGIDLCRALEFCQKQNIIHRDIKPENIFVSKHGDFKLGDFGISRTVEKTTSMLSKKGTYTYMAPEVYLGKPYGPSVDLYSLGLVLYRLLNHNRPPFHPPYPNPITFSDRERANIRRINGDVIPAPVNADPALAQVILKACAHNPADRFASPEQLRLQLEQLLPRQDARENVCQFAVTGPIKVSTASGSSSVSMAGVSTPTEGIFTTAQRQQTPGAPAPSQATPMQTRPAPTASPFTGETEKTESIFGAAHRPPAASAPTSQRAPAATSQPNPAPPQGAPVANNRPNPIPPQSAPTANNRPNPIPPQGAPAPSNRPNPVPPQGAPVVNNRPNPVPPQGAPVMRRHQTFDLSGTGAPPSFGNQANQTTQWSNPSLRWADQSPTSNQPPRWSEPWSATPPPAPAKKGRTWMLVMAIVFGAIALSCFFSVLVQFLDAL